MSTTTPAGPAAQSPPLSKLYAEFVTKEVVKAAAAHIFDDLRVTLKGHLQSHPLPGCEAQAQAVMDLLSEVECRYYNEFKLAEVMEEVLNR